MGQVEALAKYYAHLEFPEEDILDPMWDPQHVARGLDALLDYPLETFNEQFREYYEAIRDPLSRIDAPADEILVDTIRVRKTFTLTEDDQIGEVEPTTINYIHDDRGEIAEGPGIREFEDRILLSLPQMDFADDFAFESEFNEVIVAHLMAQIRDIYWNMGLEPPEEYMVEGVGKMTIHGDGIDKSPSASADEVLE
ncbi:hypothetical protein [Halococcoides cellulosivorans]|uniref:Uncharacterized protein n=1 Tax=Halococcoides cellulosivorans TaxID=1679096 RepID=A0A2R4WZ38_9EURY|nr:hypothetical protein [Halococcoides cellulosivorans]AWB26800.1 hypothetical protein HARCEL1_03250 [Halococcoides cellulosivorans]